MLSPADADEAESLAEGIRQLTRFDMSVLQAKPRWLMGPADWSEFSRKVVPYAMPIHSQVQVSLGVARDLSAMSGRNAIQFICADDDRTIVTAAT